MKKSTNILIWGLALLITLSSAIYQRYTGPTKPKRVAVEVGNETFRFNLRRSHNISRELHLKLRNAPETLGGKVIFRRYPTGDKWTEKEFIRCGNDLSVELPLQPPAGKLEYYLRLKENGNLIEPASDENIIIRFRGDVPAIFMIPHILLMFLAMLFSNLSGIMVIFRNPKYRFYTMLTFWTLLFGGLVLGPVIQNYAFGDLWTGWPLGKDLTDNKTLVAFIFWSIAFYANRKQNIGKPGLVLFASIVLLLIYLIPHSLMGSELDYSSGEVVTGFFCPQMQHIQ